MAVRLSMVACCLVALLLGNALVEGFTFLPLEKSWSQTLVVPAGQVVSAYGRLKPDLGGLLLYGAFSVRSCCGSSTDDIVFRIYGLITGRNSEKVIGSLSFEFNTGDDDYYRFEFDNAWEICQSGTCEPDTSSPSFHNKTISLSVREVATSALFSLWGFLPFLLLGAAAAVVLIPLSILIRRWFKHMMSDPATSQR